jgi:hypothetical protein
MVLSIRAGAHWEISVAEAKRLSDAVAKVARHYPVVSSQKGADWGQLILVLGTIGVPRVVQSTMLAPAAPAAAPAASRRSPSSPSSPSPPDSSPSSSNGVLTPSQLDPGAMTRSHVTAG